MRIEVVTLFPELFESALASGLLAKALAEGRASVGYVDPRSHATDRHRSVDDAPYGGGAGMVMKVDVLAPAIEEARARAPGAKVVLLCPQGRPFDQRAARRLSREAGLVLICGRYEGFDERVRALVDEELSLGDFVLTGGEYAALAIIDAVVRLQPGTLGNLDSAAADSFEEGLLEHPQYTRPPEFRGARVPEVLLGGDHGKVEAWRRQAALFRTRERRPDLLTELELNDEARLVLGSVPPRRAELHLAVSVSSSAEARPFLELALVYQLTAVHFVAEPEALGAELRAQLEAFRDSARPRARPKRANQRAKLEHALAEQGAAARRALAAACQIHPDPAALQAVLAPATWILTSGPAARSLGPRSLAAELRAAPAGARFVLTAAGLAGEEQGRVRLPSGRAGRLDPGNTGASGLAILLDRLLGEA